MDKGVIVHAQGGEGLSGQVGDPIMQLLVPICAKYNFIKVKHVGDKELCSAPISSVEEF